MTPSRRGRRHQGVRRATAAAHAALDATLRGAGCFTSVQGYRRYLGAVAPAYAALEATLDAAGAGRLLPDWPRRRKLGLIHAELRGMGAALDTLDRPASVAAIEARDPRGRAARPRDARARAAGARCGVPPRPLRGRAGRDVAGFPHAAGDR
jgi:heme oxygenase